MSFPFQRTVVNHKVFSVTHKFSMIVVTLECSNGPAFPLLPMCAQLTVKTGFSLRFFKSFLWHGLHSLLLRSFQDLIDSIIRKHFIEFKWTFPGVAFYLVFLSIAHYRSNLQNFCILVESIQKERLPGVQGSSGMASRKDRVL